MKKILALLILGAGCSVFGQIPVNPGGGGTGVGHGINGCAAITTTTATSYTCTITGGTSSSICWYAPTNAAASALLRGDSLPTIGNVPFVSISGTTATLTFQTTGTVAVTAGSTFSVACSV